MEKYLPSINKLLTIQTILIALAVIVVLIVIFKKLKLKKYLIYIKDFFDIYICNYYSIRLFRLRVYNFFVLKKDLTRPYILISKLAYQSEDLVYKKELLNVIGHTVFINLVIGELAVAPVKRLKILKVFLARQKSKINPTVVLSSELAELNEGESLAFRKNMLELVDWVKGIGFVVVTKLSQLISEEIIDLSCQRRVYSDATEFASMFDISLNQALMLMSTDKYTHYVDVVGTICCYHTKVESQIKKVNVYKVRHALSLSSVMDQTHVRHRFPLLSYLLIFSGFFLLTTGAVSYKEQLLVETKKNRVEKPLYTAIYPDRLFVNQLKKDIVERVHQHLIAKIASNMNNSLGALYYQVYLANGNPATADYIEKHIDLIADILSMNRESLLTYIQSSPYASYKSYYFKNALNNVDISIVDQILSNPQITVKTFLSSQAKIRLYLSEQIVSAIQQDKQMSLVNRQAFNQLAAVMNIKVKEFDKKMDFFNLIKKINEVSERYISTPVYYKNNNIKLVALKALINDVADYYSQHSASVMNSSYSGQGIIINNPFSGQQAKVSGLYTQAYARSVIMPGLEIYQKLQKKLEKIVDLSELNQLIAKSTENYIQSYIQSYYNFAHILFSADIANSEGLKLYLGNIISSYSLIYKGLKQINENTRFKEAPFKAINDKFSFLNTLYDNYDTSDFVMYLSSIYNNIYGGYQTDSSSQNQRLVKLVYDYYGNSEGSTLNKVKNWLPESVNPVIRNSFAGVFNQIVAVGLVGVKRNIQQVWQNQLLPSIRKIDQYYPFSLESHKIVNTDILDRNINPKSGYFWQVFNQWLKPFLVYTPNGWINNRSVVNQALLSSVQLADINRINNIAGQFWDQSGQPKALQLTVSPEMMMNGQLADKDFVNMSFLKVGDQTVIGVNVAGVNQPIQYQWWKDQSCTVGYQTSMGNSVNISNSHAPLCLFALLASAQEDNHRYQWQDKQSKVKIAYQLTGLEFAS
ncbi:hypothetical protein [Piscirickettsia litoralis]|uniref:Type VI secretion protein IcmF n=1 Tax=Piscirickettsia litoralis TaxID=1891921 RepID=A0ABX2ZWI7_9GAMM|nr:hypothetical protein [Piscirickettsia litoralis]ODN40922.1 hypothetical protein BGC07_19080 [Piscirickettsia litoralis]